MESTPRKKIVTIDLTIDNSPAREKNELRKASVDPVRSEAIIQTKFRTSNQSDCVAMEEPASVSPSRHRRRSVTFASPIKYVLDKKVKSKTQVSSSRSVACSFPVGTRSQNADPLNQRLAKPSVSLTLREQYPFSPQDTGRGCGYETRTT